MAITINSYDYNGKHYERKGNNYYCDGERIKKAQYEEDLAKSLEPEDEPTPDAPAEETPAPAPEPTPEVDYTVSVDNRGRISYKKDRTILMMVQPCRTHYTLYISKSLVSTPEQVAEKLANFKVVPVVNPTFKLKEGKDPYSVKATLTEATRNDLPDILAALRPVEA